MPIRNKSAPPVYAPEGWRSRDLSPLVGMHLTAIVGALGQPDLSCPPADGRRCAYDTDAVYFFHRLDPYDVGGGPHLALDYDAREICTEARWFITK